MALVAAAALLACALPPVSVAAQEAAFGSYPMAREASGTSWQTDAGGMEGRHLNLGAWHAMLHGFVFGIYEDAALPRGGRQAFFTNMMMLGATRPAGGGTLGLRAMVSLEPLLGGKGYRLLLQTGESGDGISHLIDRQHPHDLFMELSASISQPLGEKSATFLYLGYPGEPALGPPAFMHRRSAAGNPLAPLSHHWLDSTHIAFGVVTGGVTAGPFKVDASLFNGREPDSARWNFDAPRLDSQAARITWNPGAGLSMQVSAGFLSAPEVLHPGIDERRYTASLSWSAGPPSRRVDLSAAVGRKRRSADLPNCFISAGCFSAGTAVVPYPPNRTQDAALVEANLALGARHTFFARAERVEKDELFPGPDPFHPRVFPVGSATLGYLWELPLRGPIGWRLGAAASLGLVPEFISPDYGARHPRTWFLLAQARIR